MTTPDTDRIRKLNDALRADLGSGVTAGLAAGTLALTREVASRGFDFVSKAVAAVRDYEHDFTLANDPYGEHDFGSFELDGQKLFWKIDYFDYSLKWSSPDPASAQATRRVLTIMLAEDY